MSACSASEIARYETVVTPLADEDIASGCHYTLTIPVPNERIRAVWVIFDRAHDVHDLYGVVRRRLQSPRTERMTEMSADTPSAIIVQTKKKPPGDLAISP